MNINHLKCYGDYDLVTSQVIGTCDVVSPTMLKYRDAVDQLGGYFAGYSIVWIDRMKNKEVDSLSRVGSSRQTPPPSFFLDIIKNPLFSPPNDVDIGIPPQPDSVLLATTTSSC